MTPNLERILEILDRYHVRYVIVGGAAMVLHGSAYVTADLDIVYARDADNLEHLAAVLTEVKSKLRMPAGREPLPFRADARALANGGNFTLETDYGNLDILSTIDGLGGYAAVHAASEPMFIFPDRPTAVLSLTGLIEAKRAAGRTKDLLVLPELEAMRELRALEADEHSGPSTGSSDKDSLG